MIRIEGFDWDDNNLEHIHEHGVRDYEVEETILYDEPVYFRGKGGRYCVFGTTNEGRYLFIVIALKGQGSIRPITARNMTKAERILYHKKR